MDTSGLSGTWFGYFSEIGWIFRIFVTSKIVGGIFNHRDTYNRIRGVKEYALPIM